MQNKIDYDEFGDQIEFQLVRAIEGLDVDIAKVAASYLEVHKHFSAEPEKAWLWFKTSNPELGDVSPLRLCLMGKEQKLLNFINGRTRAI